MSWLGFVPGVLISIPLWWFLIKPRQDRRFAKRRAEQLRQLHRAMLHEVEREITERRSKARWN
jgi:hypothetical protein